MIKSNQSRARLWMRSFKILEQIWTHGIHGILCNINFSPFNIPPPTPSLSSYASKYLLCLSSPADYSTSPSQPGRWLCLDRNERPKPHSLPPSDSALLSTLPRILLKRASSAGKEFGRGSISGQFSSSWGKRHTWYYIKVASCISGVVLLSCN